MHRGALVHLIISSHEKHVHRGATVHWHSFWSPKKLHRLKKWKSYSLQQVSICYLDSDYKYQSWGYKLSLKASFLENSTLAHWNRISYKKEMHRGATEQ